MPKVKEVIACVCLSGGVKIALCLSVEVEIPQVALQLARFCPHGRYTELARVISHNDPDNLVECPYRDSRCRFYVEGFCLLGLHSSWWRLLAMEDRRVRALMRGRVYALRRALERECSRASRL